MSNASDFIIENGVLKKYVASAVEVVIPDSVVTIGQYAFMFCDAKSFVIPSSIQVIEQGAFFQCEKMVSITIPESVTTIADDAFGCCNKLCSIRILGKDVTIEKNVFECDEKIRLFFAPLIPFETVKKLGLTVPASLAYLTNSDAYTDVSIAETYRGYIVHQKKRVLQALLEADLAEGLEMYVQLNKVAEKNVREELLLPAQSIKAKKCIKFIENFANWSQKAEKKRDTSTTPTKDWAVKQLTDNTVMISGYKGADINICVPAEIGGKKVVRIAEGAFSPNKSRTNVAILKRIATVSIPETVTQIDECAFQGCEELESIVLSDNISEIRDCAFAGNRKLREIHLPKRITKIKIGTFRDCENLESINIPDGVSAVGDFAFFGCSRISAVMFPSSVTTLGGYVFSHCWNLEYICLPESVVEIGERAFSGCVNMKQIVAPGLPIGVFKDCKQLLPAAMGYLLHSEAYKRPEIIESYQKYISSQWKNILPILLSEDNVVGLKALTLCKQINKDSFDEAFLQPAQAVDAKQCIAFLLDWKSKICTEENPKNLGKELEKDPFSVAEMKKAWKYNKLSGGSIEITGYKGAETELVLPERIGKNPVTTIGKSAFIGNKELRTVEIPDSVTTIGESAFFGCENLQTLIISGKLISVGKSAFRHCPKITPQDGFVIIGNILFSYCGNDADVDIPEGTLRIEEGAFSGKTLQSITIPKSLTNIDAYAFADCKNLKKVALQNPSVAIDNTAFWGCKNLADQNGFVVVGNQLFEYFGTDQQLTIPDGIGMIKSFLFSNCSNLQTVTIPNSVTLIESWAFNNCLNLRNVFMSADIAEIKMLAFSGCDNLTIHAPAGSYAERYAKENNIPFVAE